MKNIILAFTDESVTQKLRTILASSGMTPTNTASSISQILVISKTIKGPGIVVCQAKLSDGSFKTLSDKISPDYQMVVLVHGRPEIPVGNNNITTLTLPLKKQDLIDTIKLFIPREEKSFIVTEPIVPKQKDKQPEKKKRTPEEIKLIEDAKALLMSRNNLTEEQAHRFLQKKSMDNGTKLTDTAMVILERW
jgi:hypothetical protein